ncbi:MAG: hypothetical protein R3Y46_01655 [Opitutales bacterium]
MIKIIKNKHNALKALLTRTNISTFCNIAEGTHAGFITMIAENDISKPNLIVYSTQQGKVDVAMKYDMPIGVSCDSADADEIIAIALGASVPQTILCTVESSVSAGDTLYLADYGKVSSTPFSGAYKIGVALNSASANCVVEVEPQGFGNRAWQVYACGVHTWATSSTTDSFELYGLSEGDAVIASINTAGGSETSVIASVNSDDEKVELKLNSAGTSATTKINWILIKQG